MIVNYQNKIVCSPRNLQECSKTDSAHAKKIYGIALLIISAASIIFGALLGAGLFGVGNMHYAAAVFTFAGAFSLALSAIFLTNGRC